MKLSSSVSIEKSVVIFYQLLTTFILTFCCNLRRLSRDASFDKLLIFHIFSTFNEVNHLKTILNEFDWKKIMFFCIF